MKLLSFLFALLLTCSLLTGCTSWMDGHYSSITPHTVQTSRLPDESVEVTSYQELESALVDVIENGGAKCMFYTPWAQTDSEAYIRTAVVNVKKSSPIAAYAVEDILYEVGTNAGKAAIAVDISYRIEWSEILRIKKVSNMDEVRQIIGAALESCDPNTVIYVEDYAQQDLTQYIQDYIDTHPDTCMEMPQVSAAVYPENGMDRIIAVNFIYQTSRDTLRTMKLSVSPVFSSARLYVSSDASPWEKFEQLYGFLMERYTYTFETSITPTYSLLRHGVGDSKAFATVYGAMCRQVGLDCITISGTKDGEARYWNVLNVDGVIYHVDLLECNRTGGFKALESAQMAGYVWDYSAIPE